MATLQYGHPWDQIIVLISEVSLFQGENNMKLGLGSSVLINQGVLISGVSFKRGSTVVITHRFSCSFRLALPDIDCDDCLTLLGGVLPVPITAWR